MSDFTLKLSTKTLNDTRKALEYYASISIDLEERLLDAIDSLFLVIQLNPYRYGFYRITPQFRHVKLKHFPYYILYRVDAPVVRIVGIVHTARSSRFVRRRYQ